MSNLVKIMWFVAAASLPGEYNNLGDFSCTMEKQPQSLNI